jgi:alpha-galactosidase
MQNSSSVASALRPHQEESSIVTSKEVDLARQWSRGMLRGVEGRPASEVWTDGWLCADLPFSFLLAGKSSSALLPRWKGSFTESSDAAANCALVIWTDPASGLRIAWHLRVFHFFAAVESLIEFENSGRVDSPIIVDVHALDLRIRSAVPGPTWKIHGANGGRSLPDDFMPLEWQISPAALESPCPAGMELGGDFPSSNRHLPFFNVESPDSRGIMVGIGWSGNWSARATADGTILRLWAGKTGARHILRPGEALRAPRILLMPWLGRRLHGHNSFRRLLHSHYVPALRGSQQCPLVSVNVCFTHHGYGGFLHEATEGPVRSLVKPFVELGAEAFIIDAGWYDGAPWHEWQGNWRASRAKYPEGFGPVAHPLAAAGVAFGLWFATEEANGHAPVLAEHPEWFR